MRVAIFILVTTILVSALSAQRQIFIVDNQNGPGAFSPDLPTAIAAAASGDVVIVRASPIEYRSPTGQVTVTRGISIIGVPTPSSPLPRPLVADLIVLQPDPGEVPLLASLDMSANTPGAHVVRVVGGQAVIHFVLARYFEALNVDDLSMHWATSALTMFGSYPGRLVVRNTTGRAPSRIHLQGCRFDAPATQRSGSPGITATNVELEVADSYCPGNLGFSNVVTGGNGIRGSGTLRLLGGTRVQAGWGTDALNWVGTVDQAANSAIMGSIRGATPRSIPAQPLFRHPPLVDVAQPFQLDLAGEPSSSMVVLLTDRISRVAIPGIETPLLIDPMPTLNVTQTVLDPTGRASSMVVLPDVPAAATRNWFLQGGEVTTAGELRLTGRSGLITF